MRASLCACGEMYCLVAGILDLRNYVVDNDNGTVLINTLVMKEDSLVIIRVIVIKDDGPKYGIRMSIFDQELFIATGEPPKIELK